MNMCRYHGIELWDIERKECFRFSIYVKDYKTIKSIVKKTGVRPHIICRKGWPFVSSWIVNNWTFSTGFLMFLILLGWMSSYVWEISFQGQSTYTKETLQKAVNEMGVHKGMKRSRLYCDEIEKSLRQRYSDISWVSAEEKGSRLVISIKEAEKMIPRQSEEMPCHRIAQESGVVQAISVNRGIAKVKKGQRVKKGQILISGIIPITDDGDQVVEKIPVAAKGDVTISVENSIDERINAKKRVKQYTGKQLRVYEWQVNGESIYVKNPFRRFDNSCNYDIIVTKKLDYEIQPFGLHLTMDEYQYREYVWKTILLNSKQLKKEGKMRIERQKRELQSKNYTILAQFVTIKKESTSLWKMNGSIKYLCKDTDKRYIRKKEWKVKRKEESKTVE